MDSDEIIRLPVMQKPIIAFLPDGEAADIIRKQKADLLLRKKIWI
jgi:hypothetical protein